MAIHRGAVIVPLILFSIILTTSATGWSSFRGNEENQGSTSISLDPSTLKLDWDYRADGSIIGADDPRLEGYSGGDSV